MGIAVWNESSSVTIVEVVLGINLMYFWGEIDIWVMRYDFWKVGYGENMPKICGHVISKTPIS
jgi:hypothetical protein